MKGMKRELNKYLNYITNASKNEIIDTVEISKPTIILSAFKSECNTNIKFSEESEIKCTPRQLLNSKIKPNGHVLVENGNLMEDFGYLKDLLLLNENDIRFIFLKISDPTELNIEVVPLNLKSFFIKLAKNERYYAIFILSRIYDNLYVVCKDAEKVRLFSKIFRLNNTVINHSEIREHMNVCLVMDELIDIHCETLFFVGETCDKIKEIKLNTEKAGKFLYRIKDVCNALTPTAIKNDEEKLLKRFAHIND